MSTTARKHAASPCQLQPRPDFCDPTIRHTTRWEDLWDEILIPIGSIALVFLACAAVIAMS